MLTNSDWARMTSDLTSVRADNEASVTMRRGTVTLAAQSVRIVRYSVGRALDSGQAEENRGDVFVCGGTALDVQSGDRFNSGGQLYRIKFVHPNRRAGVVAEAEVVE